MKVLFLARYFYPHIGGVEKHVREIGKRLVEKGYEVTVICESSPETHSVSNQSKPSSATFMGKVNGIKFIQIKSGKDDYFKKFRIWNELWSIRDLLKKADIIHCHDVFYWYLPFRVLFPLKPVYTTFHGYEGNNIPGRKAIFSHKIGEKLSRGNICIGDFLKKWYGTKPSIVSYGAADSSLKKNSQKIENINNFLFVGRLEEETGIMDYLKAMDILKKRGHKIKLIVLGDGSQMKRAVNFCDKKKLPVVFKGFVPDVDNYLKKCDVVFVSRYLGILEALINKKIVFAIYNNSIKKDYLEMAAFKKYIFISPNSEMLAREVEHVIINKDFQNKVNEGYKWAIKQSWDNLTLAYQRLWKTV